MTVEHSQAWMHSSRRGFTLVELMIALGLLSVIVLLLFSILSRFRNLEEKGQDQTARVRVLRSLRESIEKDVDARVRLTMPTAQDESQYDAQPTNNLFGRTGAGSSNAMGSNSADNPMGGLAFGSEGNLSGSPFEAMPETRSLGRFVGDAKGFDLDIVVTTDLFDFVSGLETHQTESLEQSGLSPGIAGASPNRDPGRTFSNSAARNKETVQTVSYRFERDDRGQDSSMLIRRLGRHTSSSSSISETASDGLVSPTQRNDDLVRFDESSEPDSDWLDGSDLYRTDESLTTSSTRKSAPVDGIQFPEISDARFRYFDGEQWVRSWDSERRLGYPVAIEIQFELFSVSELREQRRQAELDQGESDERWSSTEEPLDSINEPLFEEEEIELDFASEASSNSFGVESFELPYRVIIPVEPRAAVANSTLKPGMDRQGDGRSDPFTSSQRGGVR